MGKRNYFINTGAKIRYMIIILGWTTTKNTSLCKSFTYGTWENPKRLDFLFD